MEQKDNDPFVLIINFVDRMRDVRAIRDPLGFSVVFTGVR